MFPRQPLAHVQCEHTFASHGDPHPERGGNVSMCKAKPTLSTLRTCWEKDPRVSPAILSRCYLDGGLQADEHDIHVVLSAFQQGHEAAEDTCYPGQLVIMSSSCADSSVFKLGLHGTG